MKITGIRDQGAYHHHKFSGFLLILIINLISPQRRSIIHIMPVQLRLIFIFC